MIQGGGGGAQTGIPAEPRHSAEVRPLRGVPYRVPEGVLLRAADYRRAGVHVQRQAGLPDHPCREGVDGRDPRLSEPVRQQELALAMEARCYRGGGGRTKLNPVIYERRDFVAYVLICIFVIAVAVQSRGWLPIPMIWEI